MKLCWISDGYIDYLRSEHPHVYSNKENERLNTRKYIGTIVTANGYNYFIPLSSEKKSDYCIRDGKSVIKPDSFLIFRIRSKDKEGREMVRASIRFGNMIPVPDSQVGEYDVDSERDEKYKNVIQEELRYLRKNEQRIVSRATIIHKNKTRNASEPIYDKCLDFAEMEKMCDAWVKRVDNNA